MPPGEVTISITEEERQQQLIALRSLLNGVTVPALRQAARVWDWPLKGTAKSDLVEQMVGYLANRAHMADAVQALTAEELVVAVWLAVMGPGRASSRVLKEVLAQAAERTMTLKAIDAAILSLSERCVIFLNEYSGYQVATIYREWLPRLAVPKMQYQAMDRLSQPVHMSVTAITEHAEQLLGALAAELPLVTLTEKKPPNPVMDLTRALDPRRASLLDSATLTRWGYRSDSEQHLARFLLDQMLAAGLCRVHTARGHLTLMPAAKPDAEWESTTALERLQRLRRATMTPPTSQHHRSMSWSELDMAFPRTQSQGLRGPSHWSPIDELLAQVQGTGIWLTKLVGSLPADTWFDIESFCRVIYHVQRDFWASPWQTAQWRWVIDKQAADPQQMSFELWMSTYGRVVEAWLNGPGSWLLYVQIGYANGRPVTFRVPSTVPVGVPQQPPADVLQFMADETIELNNDWRAGELRRALRLISVEITRDATKTLLQLDPAAFRRTLHSGQDAAAVSEAFWQLGFPLPPAVQETLQTWQSRAGRYQLYDQMVVVELAEDVLPEELYTISRASGAEFFQPAPRCLVFLDPQVAPALVDELRRRGYTPRVLA